MTGYKQLLSANECCRCSSTLNYEIKKDLLTLHDMIMKELFKKLNSIIINTILWYISNKKRLYHFVVSAGMCDHEVKMSEWERFN